MKEAKSEAEQIIAAYRAEMEANYQRSLSAVSLLSRFLLYDITYNIHLCLL